jgi:alcohol dehydrogenase class IV
MKNYKITSGINVKPVIEVVAEVLAMKPNRIMLVSSPTVSKLIEIQELISDLRRHVGVDLFDEIKPDAPLSLIEKAYRQFDKPDIIIGIGGGSVIDSAKALSICWNSLEIRDLFYKRAEMPDTKIPVIAVPTTAGTGAELSFGAILYDDDLGFKGGIRGSILQPQSVFIDVALYKHAPIKLIAETGFDCLTHAIETHLSNKACPMVRYQSVAAINTVFAHLRSAVEGSEDSLREMAMASCLMGINLAFSTTCLPHRLQYVLGPIMESSHAAGLIALYRGWLPKISGTGAFAQLAEKLGTDANTLQAMINELKVTLNIDYRAGDLGLTPENIGSLVENVSGILDSDPCYQSKATLTKILENSL